MNMSGGRGGVGLVFALPPAHLFDYPLSPPPNLTKLGQCGDNFNNGGMASNHLIRSVYGQNKPARNKLHNIDL